LSSQKYIASRTILAVDKDGREFDLALAIGQPYQTGLREWRCAVSMAGLHEHLADAAGVDSWQALQLAFWFVASTLEHFIEQGGRLLWPETREPLSLEDFYGSLPKRNQRRID
jgi:hypothetical protein